MSILGQKDFKNIDEVRKAQKEQIFSCYKKDSIHKSTDEDRDEYDGPDVGGSKMFDNKNISQESAPFEHHKLMAGYHSLKADELNNEALAMGSSASEEVQGIVKQKKGESKRHAMLATEHRGLAKENFDEKKHGEWNKAIPTAKQALKYGSKQAKEIEDKHNKTKLSDEDVKKSVEEGIKKGDIAYQLQSSFGGNPIVFQKKGSELKELANVKLTQLQERFIHVEAELVTMKLELEEAGVEFISNSNPNNPNPQIKWDWKDGKDSMPDDETRTLARNYDNHVWKYQDLKCDIKALQTIADNVEDNKTYTTSISQLMSLEKAQESNKINKSEALSILGITQK